jgi:hypothetical protein
MSSGEKVRLLYHNIHVREPKNKIKGCGNDEEYIRGGGVRCDITENEDVCPVYVNDRDCMSVSINSAAGIYSCQRDVLLRLGKNIDNNDSKRMLVWNWGRCEKTTIITTIIIITQN